MSSSVSSKSKIEMFCCIRSGVTDFGMVETPVCTSHLSTICAGVLPYFSASSRISEERPAFKRRPRFKLYIVFITKGPHFLLGELWVIFQLVDHGAYRCNTEYFLKMLSVEVAYANRPHPAVFIQLFQGSPGIC